MPRPLLIVSQSDDFIQIVDTNSNTEWQTVQIQISWFLQKPTDLDLYCLQRQDISGFSRTRVNKFAEWMANSVDPDQMLHFSMSDLALHCFLKNMSSHQGFCRDWSWKIFCCHSLPSDESRRAVVSFWLKNVHNTGWQLSGLNLCHTE